MEGKICIYIIIYIIYIAVRFGAVRFFGQTATFGAVRFLSVGRGTKTETEPFGFSVFGFRLGFSVLFSASVFRFRFLGLVSVFRFSVRLLLTPTKCNFF